MAGVGATRHGCAWWVGRRVAAWSSIGATLAGVVYGMVTCRVRTVVWEGVHYTDVARLGSAVEETLLGRPMVAVSVREVAEWVRRWPVVRHVVVRKQWPDRVYVRVVERRPFAVLQDATGVKFVDVEGVPFLWFQGDLNDPAWRPPIVYNGAYPGDGRTDGRFFPVRALVEVLRQDHPWLLDQVLWLRWGPVMALELNEPRTRVLLTDECGTDVGQCRRWYRRRLQELRAQWGLILPKVLQGLQEVDLRFDGYIYLRPLKDGS